MQGSQPRKGSSCPVRMQSIQLTPASKARARCPAALCSREQREPGRPVSPPPRWAPRCWEAPRPRLPPLPRPRPAARKPAPARSYCTSATCGPATSSCSPVPPRPGYATVTWPPGSPAPPGKGGSAMSSHREAPEISKDPVADSTDVYAFVSPDRPGTVTLIANYIPLEGPAGGPNFYEFDDTVLYAINVDNNGDGVADVAFLFTFKTTLRDPSFFLYNIGPITSLSSPNWNRVQTYSLEMIDWHHGRATQLGTGQPCPPCNVGPLSTPGYANLAAEAISTFGNGIKAFAG